VVRCPLILTGIVLHIVLLGEWERFRCSDVKEHIIQCNSTVGSIYCHRLAVWHPLAANHVGCYTQRRQRRRQCVALHIWRTSAAHCVHIWRTSAARCVTHLADLGSALRYTSGRTRQQRQRCLSSQRSSRLWLTHRPHQLGACVQRARLLALVSPGPFSLSPRGLRRGRTCMCHARRSAGGSPCTR